jgi:hypothetical protein
MVVACVGKVAAVAVWKNTEASLLIFDFGREVDDGADGDVIFRKRASNGTR